MVWVYDLIPMMYMGFVELVVFGGLLFGFLLGVWLVIWRLLFGTLGYFSRFWGLAPEVV